MTEHANAKEKTLHERTNEECIRTCPCCEEFAPLRRDVEGDAVEVAW